MLTILPWSEIWNNMFTLHSISVSEKVLRPLVVYAFLVVGLRVAGKRELAQLNPLDLIVLLTLSNTVQNAIIGNDNSVFGGLIGAATLLGVNYALVRYANSHKLINKVVNGDPIYLIEDGELQEEALKKQMITKEELLAVCRRQGVRKFEDVDDAVLETSGTVTIFLKHPTPEEKKFEMLKEHLDRIESLLQARSAS